MDDILRQFQNNIEDIQNDLLRNFSMLNTNVSPCDGFKLGWWNEVDVGDVSVMFNSFQSQLDSTYPSMNEAAELERALQESLNRSMESAFAHVTDPALHTPRTCYSLGDLYKVAKTSTTEMQRRLDDFYISCKRRRAENQHTIIDEMEKSLHKTREKTLTRCAKVGENSGHSSKTRVRRLALSQKTKVPKDIDSVMDSVLNELENFFTEASQKKSMPAPEPSANAKACRGLEAALNSFYMDVSSGKTCTSLNSSSVIHDEFSTSTDEVQEAYYSCQFPILDFPPDLLPAPDSEVKTEDVKDEKDEDKDDEDNDKDKDGEAEGGDDNDHPPPSPPASSGDEDDLLSDIEVIEELENVGGEQSDSLQTEGSDPVKETQQDKAAETPQVQIDASGRDNGEPQAKKQFIDLSKDDDEVEIVYEVVDSQQKAQDDEDEAGAMKGSPKRRNIFEVLSQSAASTPEKAVKKQNSVEKMDTKDAEPEAAMEVVEKEAQACEAKKKEERLVRNEMDADEVAAAVSSILPDVTERVPPLCISPVRVASPSDHVAPTTPAPPTPSSLSSICPVGHETLLQQLMSVLDKMVELYECSEGGGRGRGSCPPARLQAMLRESFNLVLGSRQTSIPTLSGLERGGADFQSHVSAALTSFLMSPASEAGPPPSSGPNERVTGWDLAESGDAAPALGEEFCVNMDGLDRAEDAETETETEKQADTEKPDRSQTASIVSPVEQSTAPPATKSPHTSHPSVAKASENNSAFASAGGGKVMDDDDELLDELFGSPSGGEVSSVGPMTGKGLWSGHHIFLFRNHENPHAREVESMLLQAGASIFDPYHPHLVPDSCRLSVLIHTADAARTHHIPNLLQLKNVRRTRFLLFSDPVSCALQRGITLFPATASCVVLDAEVVISSHPDNLEALVNFLKEECLMNRPYRLVLHAQLRKLLPTLRPRCRDRYEVYRLDRTIQLLTSSRHEGLIEWSGDENQTTRPDALLFMLKVQQERQQTFRDFFLLSNLDPQGLKAHVFARSGIATMSLYEFIINYSTKPFNDCSTGSCLLPESCADLMQEDAPLSWSVDVLPPFTSPVA